VSTAGATDAAALSPFKDEKKKNILYIGCDFSCWYNFGKTFTRSSAIAEGPRDASCQLKSCQLPRNSADTTYSTSPDQIDGMKLEI